MQKLLSLPQNLVETFHSLEGADPKEWFCTSDPVGSKLGSGGGTAWMLGACHRNYAPGSSFDEWIGSGKRILLHAGGQSRRLPSYAPSGKILTPVPVFGWERGQRLSQNLLSLQLPLYERIMESAPDSLHTLIASGDVYIRAGKSLQEIPEADVVCYGLWVSPALATHHGVFVSDRKRPAELDFMLQKPTLDRLEELSGTHLFLMDVGIWLLSDRAVEMLMHRSQGETACGVKYYDLYSDFGRALGAHPEEEDEGVNSLSVAVLPLPDGEFYHYGTSTELISSTLAVQEKVRDQRLIMHRRVKPNPAIFIQNALNAAKLGKQTENIWIENSFIPERWRLKSGHILTGIPENDWSLELADNDCIDIVPMGEKAFALRPYGLHDAFRGDLWQEETLYLGIPFGRWMEERGLTADDLEGRTDDLQAAALFPVTESIEELGVLVRWMVAEPRLEAGKQLWKQCRRLCADDLSAGANISRLYAQREDFRKVNWQQLSDNYPKSVFYQLDLADAARELVNAGLQIDELPAGEASLMTRIHNNMLRSRMAELRGEDATIDGERAFGLLREGLTGELSFRTHEPRLNVHRDQIVWGRSPARIDVAGGWTDTPPYSLYAGGNVINLAVELNGQPPLQVYVKPCDRPCIILRSIDMGASEEVRTYEELADCNRVGSPFSIPKAALALAGFLPRFSSESHATLKAQLEAFGAGLEVTLLSAIPAGSGLGTSSILASTVLGALNDFCGLGWDLHEICLQTLVLEQLLTTGGGWQDQYGGVFPGVKLLQSEAGLRQQPVVRRLPEMLFTQPEYRACHLLYYTGITRTAKGILAEIVRSMFLNSGTHLRMLTEMKAHALEMSEALLLGDFERYGRLVRRSWMQNKLLDRGTNPPEVETLIRRVEDYALACKLPGAGGGGYLYMVAKDPEAALRIRRLLTENAPNVRARFVGMALSEQGLQVSRS